MPANNRYIRQSDYRFDTVELGMTGAINGTADFLMNPENPNLLIVDYMYFVDTNGDQIDPAAGNVTITVHSGDGIYQDIDNNTFLAANARQASRQPPNGIGRAEGIRVVTSGVSANAVGFVIHVTQSNR